MFTILTSLGCKQDDFQRVNCNSTDHSFYAICSVAIHTLNSLEITLILQPARSDVKIGRARTHANGLLEISDPI